MLALVKALRFLISQGIDIVGLDKNLSYVKSFQKEFKDVSERNIHSSIEDFSTDSLFDFIVCNAGLHFAESHLHFNSMFTRLVKFLTKNGTLFIRMTTDIGIRNLLIENENGVYVIPDGSKKYLLQ